ncbi:MAG: four helix bundle protein [Bacteroidetes bacterium]|nr:four helix bundle protein [Bacteroidota bacterium]
MNRHKELKVWQESIEFVSAVYSFTKAFPKEELYGITSQLNRASVSITANIVEGAGRNSNKEFVQFLGISMGSCAEVETLLIISEKQGFISKENFEEIVKKLNQIQNMLFRLQEAIKEKYKQSA